MIQDMELLKVWAKLQVVKRSPRLQRKTNATLRWASSFKYRAISYDSYMV